MATKKKTPSNKAVAKSVSIPESLYAAAADKRHPEYGGWSFSKYVCGLIEADLKEGE